MTFNWCQKERVECFRCCGSQTEHTPNTQPVLLQPLFVRCPPPFFFYFFLLLFQLPPQTSGAPQGESWRTHNQYNVLLPLFFTYTFQLKEMLFVHCFQHWMREKLLSAKFFVFPVTIRRPFSVSNCTGIPWDRKRNKSGWLLSIKSAILPWCRQSLFWLIITIFYDVRAIVWCGNWAYLVYQQCSIYYRSLTWVVSYFFYLITTSRAARRYLATAATLIESERNDDLGVSILHDKSKASIQFWKQLCLWMK